MKDLNDHVGGSIDSNGAVHQTARNDENRNTPSKTVEKRQLLIEKEAMRLTERSELI